MRPVPARDGTWENLPVEGGGAEGGAAAGAGRTGRPVGQAATQSQSEGRWRPGSREETRAGGGQIHQMGGGRAAAGSEEAAPGACKSPSSRGQRQGQRDSVLLSNQILGALQSKGGPSWRQASCPLGRILTADLWRQVPGGKGRVLSGGGVGR